MTYLDISNQMKIADLILKVYQYRYDKFNSKIGGIKDILAENSNESKEFQEKVEKLEKLDAKLSQVEAKIQIMNKRIDKTYFKLESLETVKENNNVRNKK